MQNLIYLILFELKREENKTTYLITGFISVLCKSDCNCTKSTQNWRQIL